LISQKNGVLVNIGVDDIDSPRGGCTTHLVAKLVKIWSKRSWVKFIDYPNLIRLSPTVPWKTRGNGALALRLIAPSEDKALDLYEEAVNIAIDYVSEFRHPESHPALAIVLGKVDQKLRWLGLKAVQDIVPLDLLNRILAKIRNMHKNTRIHGHRGLIGAYAAIGLTLSDTDYTFELIAYRKPENYGKPRAVDPESVKLMDKLTKDSTFLNYDYEVDKPLITPHGPDPVLFGIRGEDPEALVKAMKIIKVYEPIEMWVVFRTNQATDMHLRRISSIKEAYIYTGIILRAKISSIPRRIQGGHVIFRINDGVNEIDVAAYEPTGGFRNIVEQLRPGDIVEVYGTVRPPSSKHGPTINLEKIYVVSIAPEYRFEAPRCPKCNARMKSMGRGKGYKCPKCGYKDPKAKKIAIKIPRKITPGWYQPPPRAFKHLMKPIERFGKEKKLFNYKLIQIWHS